MRDLNERFLQRISGGEDGGGDAGGGDAGADAGAADYGADYGYADSYADYSYGYGYADSGYASGYDAGTAESAAADSTADAAPGPDSTADATASEDAPAADAVASELGDPAETTDEQSVASLDQQEDVTSEENGEDWAETTNDTPAEDQVSDDPGEEWSNDPFAEEPDMEEEEQEEEEEEELTPENVLWAWSAHPISDVGYTLNQTAKTGEVVGQIIDHGEPQTVTYLSGLTGSVPFASASLYATDQGHVFLSLSLGPSVGARGSIVATALPDDPTQVTEFMTGWGFTAGAAYAIGAGLMVNPSSGQAVPAALLGVGASASIGYTWEVGEIVQAAQNAAGAIGTFAQNAAGAIGSLLGGNPQE